MSEKSHVFAASDFSDKGLSVRLGRFFFKSRNFISAPIFLFLICVFFWEYENGVVTWTVGSLIIVAGEGLRVWAMRHIGRSARTRKDKARKLVATGPYKHTRNPLYVGNHIILLGFCVLSELVWFAPIALGICFVFYSFIITYEEDLLMQRFGEDYVRYMAETPRWIPLRCIRNMLSRMFTETSWQEAFRREKSTIYGIIIGFGAFGVKEIISHIVHGL
jgi:protein-S-isoprenylcysteine O-methyltransferase Ste14